MNKDDNKTLRTRYTTQSCVIVADRDGVKKYVSKNFPNLFQYTVKLEDARQFKDAYEAHGFIDSFRDSKFNIINPQVISVTHIHVLNKGEIESERV